MAGKILKIQLFSQALYLRSSTQRVQTLLEITLSLRVFEIKDIFNFRKNSRWQPKYFIPKINVFLHFAQKFKMAAKNGSKAIFVKYHHYTVQIPCGLKISSKSFYLELFPR